MEGSIRLATYHNPISNPLLGLSPIGYSSIACVVILASVCMKPKFGGTPKDSALESGVGLVAVPPLDCQVIER